MEAQIGPRLALSRLDPCALLRQLPVHQLRVIHVHHLKRPSPLCLGLFVPYSTNGVEPVRNNKAEPDRILKRPTTALSEHPFFQQLCAASWT
jgi:hypothetical protein